MKRYLYLTWVFSYLLLRAVWFFPIAMLKQTLEERKLRRDGIL